MGIRRWHDKHIKLQKMFKEGDQVLLFNSRLRLFQEKLTSRWSGSFTVTQVSPHGEIEVSHPEKGTFKGNGHQLKLYLRGDFHKSNKEALHLGEPS